MKIQTYIETENWREGEKLTLGEIVDKEKAHEGYLLHKSAHLLLFNPSGEIYCRKRLESELRYPGMYTSTIGTHVSLNNNYIQTLINFEPYIERLKLNYEGEFRVRDDFENEVCGLYVGVLEKPEEVVSNSHFFITQKQLLQKLKNNKITPHLGEAFKLYQSKK